MTPARQHDHHDDGRRAPCGHRACLRLERCAWDVSDPFPAGATLLCRDCDPPAPIQGGASGMAAHRQVVHPGLPRHQAADDDQPR